MIKIVYNNFGYTIGTIYINIEFKDLTDKVKDELGVKLNYTDAYDHVP